MQNKRLKVSLSILVALAAVLVSLFAAGSASASGLVAHKHASGGLSPSVIKGPAVNVTGQTQNLFHLSKTATTRQLAAHPRLMPLLVSPKLAQAKKVAAQNKNAPHAAPIDAAAAASAANSPKIGFQGMADSPTICPYFGGCQPPDMALATSPKFVFQGVNTSFALYNTSGTLVAGPFNSQVFFGIPNPPNNCDPAGPFTSDPRAFYDPTTGLFWAAMLQVEGALGVGPNCPFQSAYWVANFNPNTGTMHTYSFDMTLGTTNVADYTQFGFNKDSVALTANMFNQAGSAYVYAETFFANKHKMETGAPVTANFFTHFAVGSVLLDTVQPVETITPTNMDPGVEYLVNTFNINGDPFGNDCFSTACQGFVTWAYDASTNTISGSLVLPQIPNPTYISPPNADQPGCFQCVETIDTRITGTPVYSIGSGNGLISFSIDTAVNNGVSVVPGILWGQIQPSLSGGALFNAYLFQGSYLNFSGDRDASFGAMMQDKNGRLVMVFDTMSADLNPSIMVTERLKNDPLNNLRPPSFLIKGTVATFNTRWGDYEAASYDGFSTNHIWVAAQYSIGDWATFIARV
ncbi:MAG: hypothetical protein M3Z08_05635 [Chloroflexota bacterium]|nr:hypothetical protein [Chloroflexota bacterium]